MNTKSRQWILIDVLNKAVSFLESKNIENSRLNAEHLLSHALGQTRIELYLHFEEPLTKPEREKYKQLLRRRAEYEPLQYILEETEFMSLPFYLNPNVLIPRPETEILVESIIERAVGQRKMEILDIGCGSGAISVSLAKYIEDVKVTAVDISEDILKISEENAKKNEVSGKIKFICSDVKSDKFIQQVGKLFDIVAVNPPYVSGKEWSLLPLEIQNHEPRQALCDEGDGLSFYRLISESVMPMLKKDGSLFFEVGDRQSSNVKSILEEYGYKNIQIIKDLNHIDRVVAGVKDKG